MPHNYLHLQYTSITVIVEYRAESYFRFGSCGLSCTCDGTSHSCVTFQPRILALWASLMQKYQRLQDRSVCNMDEWNMQKNKSLIAEQ